MESQTSQVLESELDLERKDLARAGQLHWFHWLVVILSGVLTLSAWYFFNRQVEDKTRARFDRETAQVIALVTERMQKYEDVLWSGVATIHANAGRMEYSRWRAFAESLQIDRKYPGISGIGVIESVRPEHVAAHVGTQRRTRPQYRIHPEHDKNEYLPIVYIEPQAPNAKALGLDMAHETNRYNAAAKARSTGAAQITGPIVLVQDAGATPGFLFYAPYYAESGYGTGQERTEQERTDKFSGMVYAPFVVKRLLAGTLDKERRHVGVRLSDGDEIIYDELTKVNIDFDVNPLFTERVSIQHYGRTWNFDIWSTKSFRKEAETNQSGFILIGGGAIDALLLTMFVMLTRGSRRTLGFADRMTAELQKKAAALAKSNADLESFAYVASHDLKTPLRGISDLVTYLEEDLDPYMTGADSNPDVRHNIQRLHQQTYRMDNLIRGILDYSSVGGRSESVETVAVGEILESLRLELGVRDDQLIFEGRFPVLNTYRVRFEQVMNNLIGNAFKYHHDFERAIVTVSSRNIGSLIEFSVSDDGPGIDPKFHSRIFEVFQTLQSKDEVEGTGVGLAIVKKSVEALGGTISVSSKPGEGTTFTFQWPQSLDAKSAKASAAN